MNDEYHEVPDGWIDPAVLKIAKEVVAAASAEMDITRPRLGWYRRGSPTIYAPTLAFRDDEWPGDFTGIALREKGVIYLRDDLDCATAALTAAHEVRHVAHVRLPFRFRDLDDHELREADAEAWAQSFIRRYESRKETR